VVSNGARLRCSAVDMAGETFAARSATLHNPDFIA
jgi:hypothetical protein